jgi:hypothetical protein
MKKLFLGLALVLFVGTVSASIYAVSNQTETEVAQSNHDGGKDKKCEKKDCCKNAKKDAKAADKSVEGKACCQKDAMKKCDEKSGAKTCDKSTEKKACCQKPAAAEHK